MLPEAMMVLAGAGGTAVVQAAGTDAWEELRDRLARWFGRGEAIGEREACERLDRSAAELEAADAEQRARTRQETAWAIRIEDLLDSLDDQRRSEAASELQQLLDDAARQPTGGHQLGSGNTFNGPTAVQIGDHNRQDNRFGPQP